MPNQPRPSNRHRMVRVEDKLWDAAQAKAAEEGTTVSQVVRDALGMFVGGAELGSAARAVDRAWTEYIDSDDLDGIAAAVGRLREALDNAESAAVTRR